LWLGFTFSSNLRRIGATDLRDTEDKPTVDSLHKPPSDSGDSTFELSPSDDHSNGETPLAHNEQDVEMSASSHRDAPNDTTPPLGDLPFVIQDPASGESEFMIYLEFPGQDRPRLRYQVYRSMPVRLLYKAIANGILECEDHQIRIFVDDPCLLHLGTITDRYFPGGSEVPTVFLYPNCTAFVRRSVGPLAEPMPTTTPTEIAGESMAIPPRRISTRVPVPRVGRVQDTVSTGTIAAPRRPVGDRWFYDPIVPAAPDYARESSSADAGMLLVSMVAPDLVMSTSPSMPHRHRPLMLGPVGDDVQAYPPTPLTKQQKRQMLKQCHAEGRRRRRMFRKELQRDWESQVAPAFDQENDHPDVKLIDEESAYYDFMSSHLARYDDDLALKKVDFLDDLSCTSLSHDLLPGNVTRTLVTNDTPDALVLERTAALWAGLRRV
jgi:hypothetical protein